MQCKWSLQIFLTDEISRLMAFIQISQAIIRDSKSANLSECSASVWPWTHVTNAFSCKNSNLIKRIYCCISIFIHQNALNFCKCHVRRVAMRCKMLEQSLCDILDKSKREFSSDLNNLWTNMLREWSPGKLDRKLTAPSGDPCWPLGSPD